MVNESLKKYLLTYHDKGWSYEALREYLLQQGIAQLSVDEAIAAAKEEEQNKVQEENQQHDASSQEIQQALNPQYPSLPLFSPWRVFFFSLSSGFLYYLWWIKQLGDALGIHDQRFFIPLLNWIPLYQLSKQLAEPLKRPWHGLYLFLTLFWFIAPLVIQSLMNDASEQLQHHDQEMV